jgi:hypothetical protein
MGELFEEYYDYVRRLCRRKGIPAQEVDDTASDIMLRLYERDVPSMFDPGYVSQYDGKSIPANWKTFLTAQVNLYLRGKRDAIERRRYREPALCDQLVGSAQDQTWAEVFGGWHEDDHSAVDVSEFRAGIREYLRWVPKRSAQDHCDLVALFDEIMAEVAVTGEISHEVIRGKFGISSTSSHSWLRWLQQNVREATVSLRERPTVLLARQRRLIIPSATLAPDGSMTFLATPVQARHAISALQTARGLPFVKQPLEAAGSPLARMDYHAVARAERIVYPSVEVPAGTHSNPGGHVKAAVIHYLNRQISEA